MGSGEYLYGMSPTTMESLQTGTSTHEEREMATLSPYNQHPVSTSSINNPSQTAPPSGGLGHIPYVMPMLNMTSFMSVRHQLDESNHEMVNMLTQQMTTLFNPLNQNTNQFYELLANQIGRRADFFGAP